MPWRAMGRHRATSLLFAMSIDGYSVAPADSPFTFAPLVAVPPAPVLRAEAEPAASAAYRYGKPLIDRVLAGVALILTLPVWLAVALVVRATSTGPVLFRQTRLGREGRPFVVLKFRTMRADAELRLRSLGLYDTYVTSGYKLPAAAECRLTSVGRFLRRTSLDELPQLLNVLRGDMSVIGPRPIVPDEIHCYGDLAYCYLGVRPGITGIWQVTGRSHVQFPDRAELDRRYYEQRSLLLDVRILLRTPMAVLRADGAY